MHMLYCKVLQYTIRQKCSRKVDDCVIVLEGAWAEKKGLAEMAAVHEVISETESFCRNSVPQNEPSDIMSCHGMMPHAHCLYL